MKPASFDYHRPGTVEEVVGLLAELGEDAKILAGGQSLVPMLSMRLAYFDHLIDISRLPELQGIEVRSGQLWIGAGVTEAEVGSNAQVRHDVPLLTLATPFVGHPQIRNRGTVGGSVAHADPAAEMPGIVVACDAEIAVIGKAGARTIKAGEFFEGPLMTVLAPDEIIVEIKLPAWPSARRWGFQEFARRRGDFALAAAAVFYDQDANGRARNAHVGVIGVADRPLRLPSVEAVLNGNVIDEATIAKADAAAAAAVNPDDDIHASSAYRKSLLGTMVERALKAAASR